MWSPNLLNDEVLNSVPLLDDHPAVMLLGSNAQHLGPRGQTARGRRIVHRSLASGGESSWSPNVLNDEVVNLSRIQIVRP